MKNLKSIIALSLLLFASLGFTACLDDNDEDGRTIIDTKDYVLTIASHKVLGVVSPGENVLSEVYVAKKNNFDSWVQQSGIEGFEYEEGYEYNIKVKETSYLDYSMGDPVWTEYKMTELISKEKKTSENVPTNLIPEWYEPQNNIRIQYAVEADDKEMIETDLKSEATLPWNCKMEFTGSRYAIWDNKNKVVDFGKFIKKARTTQPF